VHTIATCRYAFLLPFPHYSARITAECVLNAGVEWENVCSSSMECRAQASSVREASAGLQSLSHVACAGTLPAGVKGPGGLHVQVVRVRICQETLPSCCAMPRVCQGKLQGCWDAQGATLCELQQPSQASTEHCQHTSKARSG
jgi:hypothetical protein